MRKGIFPCVIASILTYMLILAFGVGAVLNDNSAIPLNRPKNLVEAMAKAGQNDRIPVIVTFTKTPTEADYAMLDRVANFKPTHKYSIIDGAAGELTKGQINALSRIDIVERIKLDKTLKLCLDSSTYWYGTDDVITDFGFDGAGVTIAVMDTGIDANHIDLDGGKVVDWIDYVKNEPEAYDDDGHGTHCASICAGTGEGNSAYRGVAPGASLVGIKVIRVDTREAFESNVMAGLDWVVNNGNHRADIITMSLGRMPEDGELLGDEELLAVACNNAVDAGVIIVVAAGNEGPAERTLRTPGVASNVITVGAMADIGEGGFYQTQWSSRGPTGDGRIKPDISAPGLYITAADNNTGNKYISYSGTSMATPFTAGVVALMLQANPNLTNDDVKTMLMSTAIDWGPPGVDIDFGAGRLDAYAAVDLAYDGVTGDTKPSVPNHFYAEETIAQRRKADEWSININDTKYPIAISLIAPDFVAKNWRTGDPNFDLILYNPDGKAVASYAGGQRQDTLSYQPTITGSYTLQVKSSSGSGNYFFDLSAGASEVILASDDDPSAPDVHDVAIASIDVPSTVGQETISVGVVVTNEGTYTETTTVSLSDLPGEGVSLGSITPISQSVNLSPGASETVTFTWETTGCPGTHVLEATASAVDGEVDLADNVKQTEVTVSESVSQAMQVSRIDMSTGSRKAGPNTFGWAIAKITVVASSGGTPLSGVTVIGHWEGATSDSDSGITVDGSVSLLSDTVKNPGSATFTFNIDSISMNGWYDDGGGIRSDSIGFNVAPALVSTTELLNAYPSIANPEVWIPFKLSQPEYVTIRIYDATGRLVKKLDLGQKSQGTYISKSRAAYWDGTNEAGERVASGMYFYTMEAGEYTATRKMLMLK